MSGLVEAIQVWINNPAVSYSQICQSKEPFLLSALGGIL